MAITRATNPFHGRWRIIESELWEQGDLDLVVPAFIEFDRGNGGEFAFVAVQGDLDCRFGERAGVPGVEFSWEGQDEGDEVMGRGWAILRDGTLEVRWFVHLGDESWLRAMRVSRSTRKRPPARRMVARHLTSA